MLRSKHREIEPEEIKKSFLLGLLNYALRMAAVLPAVLIIMMLAPRQAPAVTADEPVTGVSAVTPAQLEAELASVNPNHAVPNIAQLYVEWGYRFGIRADVAFAQMLHETNFLKFTGVCRPEQNNFAGIGATRGDNPGNSFASPELGVIAHYAHLAWYVYPDHRNEYCNTAFDPRHFGSGHNGSVHKIRDLNGKWAVPGDGYGEAIARYATQIWSYPQQGQVLGSFNEEPGSPQESLKTAYYFPWYDTIWSRNWIVVGNQGTGAARVRITIGQKVIHDPDRPANDFFSIPEGGRITPFISNLIGGPVKVESLDGQPLIASQRVLFGDSFNEVLGIPASQLSDSWEFTWYDDLPANGMNGNWVLFANMGSEPADVEISVGGSTVAAYAAARGNAVGPGVIVTPQFPGIMAGPVRVRSTNHQPLIASQRVIHKESFTEVMGVQSSSLGSEYLFTWYDSIWSRNWILAANRGSQPADVDIFVGNSLKARYSSSLGNAIPPGGVATPFFANLMDGPVRVVSTNGQPIMASQRVLYRDGMEEVQGIQPSSLTGNQLFSWYDSKLVNYMRGDWLLVANRGPGDARAEIYIGDQKMRDPQNPANEFFIIPDGGRITPQFDNIMGGPVRVVSLTGQPLLASQRVLFKDGLAR